MLSRAISINITAGIVTGSTIDPIFIDVVFWGEIYDAAAVVLLENGGFTLNLVTDGQFYVIAGEVLMDFCMQAGITRRIWNQPVLVGQSVYQENDRMGELDDVYASQQYLYRSSDFYQDNNNANWAQEFRQPTEYHEDSLPIEQIQVIPAPWLTGDQIAIAQGQGLFGTIAGTSYANDFDLAVSIQNTSGFRGTISECFGNPFVETQGPFFGLLAEAIPDTNNISMLGVALPVKITGLTASSPVELLPDSLTTYLKYGILAKIFSGDSEEKDTDKANYCAARYQEGVNLAQAIVLSAIKER